MSKAQFAQPQTPSPELLSWVASQLQAGCRPDDVLAAMRSSGWQDAVGLKALEQGHAHRLADQAAASADGLPAATPVPEPDLKASPSALWAGDREVQVLMSLVLPRVVVFGNFLSHQECDELVALAQPRMARSETVVHVTGGNEVNEARTSDGMFFGRAELPLCERIEKRIAALVNWPEVNGEGLQVLHYRPGAEYRPHHDYFDPAQPGTPSIVAVGGQRVGTVVMYLNTPEQGGGTTFPELGLEMAPIKGNAVFFSYNRPHPSTRTLHGGAPVLAGEKWVATKWLRERPFE
ncbi:MAG: 2OG-Fe(II) oxygenase [Burkholderiales bacterium]|nr:2OG-Fe(II) oxygenase [Burkholderiales bacterium]